MEWELVVSSCVRREMKRLPVFERDQLTITQHLRVRAMSKEGETEAGGLSSGESPELWYQGGFKPVVASRGRTTPPLDMV